MLNFKKVSVAVCLAVATVFGSSAQEYKLPGTHAAEHSQLIAGQGNIKNKIKTDKYIQNLVDKKEKGDMEVYSLAWESQYVNCYDLSKSPSTATIDVSNFAMPCKGHVTSAYGWRPRFGREHKGVDLKAATGDTIYAAFDGKVRITRYEKNGYGHFVLLRHTNDLETVYGHFSKTLVKRGQVVKAGDPIGLAGNTGRSFGAHLHFETRYMGYPINPSAIFDFDNRTVHTDVYNFNKNTYKQARNYSPESKQVAAARRKK